MLSNFDLNIVLMVMVMVMVMNIKTMCHDRFDGCAILQSAQKCISHCNVTFLQWDGDKKERIANAERVRMTAVAEEAKVWKK
jgi:hypothetical protein